jgi:hypothetical protein
MKKAVLALLVLLGLAACNFTSVMQPPAPPPVVAGQPTGAASAEATRVISTPTTALAAASPPPTLTAVPPTAEVTPTTTVVPVDAAEFVADVTIPDGTRVKPGETFVKTWRLRNLGSTTWTGDYALVFANGAQMDALALVLLGKTVAPGEEVDVSVTLTAPMNPGSYRGYWRLRSASGILFGVGPRAEKPFLVSVKVSY